MGIFLKSLGRDVHLAISNEFKEPIPWDDKFAKAYEVNAKATYALMQILNDDDLSRIINCVSAMRFGMLFSPLIRGHPKSRGMKLTC